MLFRSGVQLPWRHPHPAAQLHTHLGQRQPEARLQRLQANRKKRREIVRARPDLDRTVFRSVCTHFLGKLNPVSSRISPGRLALLYKVRLEVEIRLDHV